MALDLSVTLLVLGAACMHATWNALVKVQPDRALAFALIQVLCVAFSAVLMALTPLPRMESWGYLAGSLLLQEGYMLALLRAYRTGDLSQVYPLTRGSAPLGVALITLLLLDRPAGPLGLTGVGLVSLGVLSLAWTPGARNASARLRGGWQPVAYALAAGAMIATYTVLDSLGVRASGTPLGYGAWLFMGFSLPWLGLELWRRPRALVSLALRAPLVGSLGGLCCFGAYLAVVWALSLGAPAPISALRETSIIFAALIGSLVLKEPFGLRRVLAAGIVAAGVALIQLG